MFLTSIWCIKAIDDGLIDTSRSMHVGIRGSVNDHEDIIADEQLVRQPLQVRSIFVDKRGVENLRGGRQ